MTDHELLETAAKAAGIELPHFVPYGFEDWVREGNPLEDDGDALRLAAALDIRMTPGAADSPYAVAEWWVRPSLTTLDFERILVEDDRAAALRRAVVLAAAAIGAAPAFGAA